MLEDLEKLINFLMDKYNEIEEEWKKNDLYNSINMKKSLVKNLYIDNGVLDNIFNYRAFINERNLEMSLQIDGLELKSRVNTRVKARNSIEFKINNYIKNHNNGEGPINKCFNDLYGVRIILSENISFDEIKKFIEDRFPNLKCIDSSKEEGYIATHIYFKNDNYSFQWELQIWNITNEMTNILSHQNYKQEYIKWEKENKGGELF